MKLFAGGLLALFLVAAATLAPGYVERSLNPLDAKPPYAATLRAQLLARDAVDLHADTLLWARDPLERAGRGHLDVPRLLDAGVALQVFGVVTRSPHALKAIGNPAEGRDDITSLAVVERWPLRTWFHLRERALYQAQRLRDAAERSGGRLALVRSRADLDALLARRARGERVVGGLLALEGSHALEGKLENVAVLEAAGFRMMSPAHFFDSEISGSAHGAARGGLTPLGRRWVRELEARHILIDLAHASPATVDDVLALATRPVIVSHTGVKATCNTVRNLSDEQLRGVARTGGLVGIGVWPEAVCGHDADAIARAIRHALRVAGPEHVALGTDFDGTVEAPFDVTGLPLLADALGRQGVPPPEIRAVFGENALRVLGQTLP